MKTKTVETDAGDVKENVRGLTSCATDLDDASVVCCGLGVVFEIIV